jgi:hypothetical protein
MAQDNKDLLVGKTLRQYREAREHLAMLKAEAADQGTVLVRIGHSLKAYPEFLIQEHEAADSRFLNEPQTTLWRATEIPTVERIKGLTSDIRQQSVKVWDLRKSLKDMGQDV